MSIDHKKPAQQATALIAGQVLASLSEAVVPIIMVRFLPMTEVGILSAILLIYTLLAPIFASAFPHSLMYFLPTRGPAERKALSVKIAVIMFFLGFLAGCLMLVLGLVALLAPTALAAVTDKMVGGVSAFGPDGLKYLVVLGLMPLGDFPVRMLPSLLVIEERAGTAAMINVVKSLILLCSILVPILLGCDLWWIVGSYSLAGLCSGFFLLFYIRRLYPCAIDQVAAESITTAHIFKFTVPLGLNETVMQLYNKIDLFLVAMAFPALVVALYRAGAWQVPFITTIAYSVGAVYAPHLRRLFEAGKAFEAIALWQASIRKVTLITVPLGLICIVGAEEIIELLFTRDYLEAANVFRLYCLLTLGRVAAFGPVLVAAGRPRLVLRVAALSFGANILFSLPLMWLLGWLGPALGSVLAFIVHITAFCWCIGSVAQLPTARVFPLRHFLTTMAIGFLSCGPALALKYTIDLGAGWSLLCILISTLLSFSICGTFFGKIKKDDWQIVARLLLPGMLSKGLR